MQKLVLAAAFVMAAASASLAQDFNPGTVIGNVYQNPNPPCSYGLGCHPDYRPSYYWRAHHYRHHRRRIRHQD
jgi:hypothetical protein